MSEPQTKGTLIIIGGAEDKKADKTILKAFIASTKKKAPNIALITTATNSPGKAAAEYKQILSQLGADNIHPINITCRDDTNDSENIKVIRDADGIFFVGGDQLRISSILGGTDTHKAVLESYNSGKVIAGTSAGASMMSEIMVVEGNDEEAPRKCTLKMAPGMGLLEGVIIDQHFNQRGRIGRLLAAVAQNPNILGIGIDEDTAIIVHDDLTFDVTGSGVATVIDGRAIRYTNISEQYPNEPLAITNVMLHVLPSGYGFNIPGRQEIINSEDHENSVEIVGKQNKEEKK
ncbi:MAG: cyanophycinase [Bacillota bacterium]